MRILKINVGPTCQNCPFCRYDSYYDRSHDSGWDCENEDSDIERIVNDWNVNNSNNKKPAGWPKIPEKCPLPKTVG